jgi:hypothetical protein
VKVEWSKPIDERVRGTLGQVLPAAPAPPGWTGPWPPPKPPFWDLTGMQWLPTGDFPKDPPFGWSVTGQPWPPPRPPGYPAGWDWPLKPPPGWLAPPTSAPSSSPGSPPPAKSGAVPSSSSESGDSMVYVVGGALVVGLFLILLGGSGAALQENAGEPQFDIYLERVPLNRGGYDRRGRYWGVGAPLYRYYDDVGAIDGYVRAHSREEAKAKARYQSPGMVLKFKR